MKDNYEFNKPMSCFLPSELKEVKALFELSLDLRWSWDHSADEVWRQLDPELWEITQNPWVLLQTVSRDRFRQLIGDSSFRDKIDSLVKTRKHNNESPAWFKNSILTLI